VLQAAARAGGVSLYEYCVRRLAASGPAIAADQGAAALVTRAAALTGDALVGVVVYGSWARSEATPTSDVDVLVVVEPAVALTRSIYRSWDEAPVQWQGRPVDAHFVHAPDARVRGGVWGEAAIDGIVLFERDHRLSAHLASVRRAIADGRLVRRVVHGQPYWIEAA
jgi:predicted nucleotidyltransferase